MCKHCLETLEMDRFLIKIKEKKKIMYFENKNDFSLEKTDQPNPILKKIWVSKSAHMSP